MLEQLHDMTAKAERCIVGLMSGTSIDGIDAALVAIQGHGQSTSIRLIHFECYPYSHDLQARLLEVASGQACTAVEFARLDFRVANCFAQAALAVVEAASRQPEEIDLIASHGQTLAHSAKPGTWHAATWQAGNPAALAAQAGIPVMGDFRSADVALGGTGAPLAPYPDFLLRKSDHEGRVVLNLGGIANLTYLPRRASLNQVLAWDVGPANMLSDALSREYLQESFDADGSTASRGTVDDAWLEQVLQQDFFQWSPPKCAGREEFGDAWMQTWKQRISSGWPVAHALATASELTVHCVLRALEQLPQPSGIDRVLVTGGGRHNGHLMQRLAARLAPIRVDGLESLGENADAKEAVDFAVLGNEALFSHAGNLTQVTAAERPVVLGVLTGMHSRR